ncbi:HGxxPAAW family protein [Streptomyces sp. NPDC012935]|uniref:HGxxPAAW family protein n=1 Tax=Streptomyces sp. NPDC012935 TaxID=3364857 RepID=UPI0036C7D17C
MFADGDEYDEGHTVAGWTGVGIATLGAAVTGVGLCVWRPVGVWLGLGIMALSVLVTWALHLMGWGKPSGPRPHDQWSWKVRDLTARNGHADCVGCRMAGRRPEPAATPAVITPPVTDPHQQAVATESVS